MKNLVCIWLTVFLCTSVFGENENKKVLVTDALDDDIRSFLHIMGDPEQRSTVDSIVITTGNTQLKAAITRRIVTGLGLDIPVYAGTATDLSENESTSFAGNLEKEGLPILSEHEINALERLEMVSGDGALRLAQRFQQVKPGEKLDVVLLTAPTDLVTALAVDKDASKTALGSLFGMGLHKTVGTTKIVAPYNAQAGKESVAKLYELYNEGIFENFYHVPTDTVQQRSGLPGGYIPEDGPNQRWRERMVEAMRAHPVLDPIHRSALEYAYSWRSSAVAQFGLGFGDSDRWVPNSFGKPDEAVGFYLADSIPVDLSKLNPGQLAKGDFNQRGLKPVIRDGDLVYLNDGQVRPTSELNSFDGERAVENHVTLLENMGQFSPLAEYSQPLPGMENVPTEQKIVIPVPPAKTESLVVVFKNSPDDWFALAHVLATEKGREALAKGGVVVEGFETKEVAQMVRNYLADLGETAVPVAAGTEYKNGEVDSIPNFVGERAFYGLQQGTRAFKELPHGEDKFGFTPHQLISRAAGHARKTGGTMDAIILGEGVDFLKATQNPKILETVGSAYVMGGGRIVDGALQFTRNWRRKTDEVVSGLENLAKKGKNVFVFSSNEFGGSLVSKTSGDVGNGAVAFRELNEAGETIPALAAAAEHWENWSRVFGAVMPRMGQLKDQGLSFDQPEAMGFLTEGFDPHSEVPLVTISPLALTIADEWVKQELENGRSTIKVNGISLEKLKTSKGTEATGFVRWLRRDGGQEIVPLARRFGKALENIIVSREANKHHHAVRDQSILSDDAQSSLRTMNGKGNCDFGGLNES